MSRSITITWGAFLLALLPPVGMPCLSLQATGLSGPGGQPSYTPSLSRPVARDGLRQRSSFRVDKGLPSLAAACGTSREALAAPASPAGGGSWQRDEMGGGSGGWRGDEMGGDSGAWSDDEMAVDSDPGIFPDIDRSSSQGRATGNWVDAYVDNAGRTMSASSVGIDTDDEKSYQPPAQRSYSRSRRRSPDASPAFYSRPRSPVRNSARPPAAPTADDLDALSDLQQEVREVQLTWVEEEYQEIYKERAKRAPGRSERDPTPEPPTPWWSPDYQSSSEDEEEEEAESEEEPSTGFWASLKSFFGGGSQKKPRKRRNAIRRSQKRALKDYKACSLEELEETARLWLMTDPKPAPLDAAALKELRQTFGARW